MNKKILILSAIVMLTVSACGSAAPAAGPAAAAGGSAPAAAAATPQAAAGQGVDAAAGTAAPAAGETSELMQLVVGTLGLTGDQAITDEQKGVLLPLWSELRTLSISRLAQPGAPGQAAPGAASATPEPQGSTDDTQAQIDALVSQIKAAMTPDQLAAIGAMNITQDSLIALMQELGIGIGRGQGGDGAAAQPPPGGIQPPGGSPPGAGEQSGSDQPLSDLPQLNEGTAQPPQGAPGGASSGGQQPSGEGRPSTGGRQPGGWGMRRGGMIPPQMFDALIEALGGAPAEAAPAPSAAGPGASTGTAIDIAALYTQTGGTETKTGGSYVTPDDDQTAVYVTGGGVLTLSNATIETSGDTSSADDSSFHGLNAAVLAAGGSTITLSDSSISTTGSGANGAFATGAGSTMTLSRVRISASGDGGHAVMVTNGGTMTLTDVEMTTAGKNSGAIATDRGGGKITVTGGSATTTGQDSPGIYSTGDIKVTSATISATGAEAAVIEGANSITLVDTDLSSSMDGKWGVMIYQSMSGDAEGTRGVFTMTGGALANTAAAGPLFYVNNSTGVITLKGVKVTAASGILVDASANSRWGASGSNGGNVIFTADSQALAGDLTADEISTLAVKLQYGSTLTGAIDAAATAKTVELTLDASSIWSVTADSNLTCLNDTYGVSGTAILNITGNGHTVTYDPAACPALDGKTYTLNGGGTLQPAD